MNGMQLQDQIKFCQKCMRMLSKFIVHERTVFELYIKSPIVIFCDCNIKLHLKVTVLLCITNKGNLYNFQGNYIITTSLSFAFTDTFICIKLINLQGHNYVANPCSTSQWNYKQKSTDHWQTDWVIHHNLQHLCFAFCKTDVKRTEAQWVSSETSSNFLLKHSSYQFTLQSSCLALSFNIFLS